MDEPEEAQRPPPGETSKVVLRWFEKDAAGSIRRETEELLHDDLLAAKAQEEHGIPPEKVADLLQECFKQSEEIARSFI